jgi:hypothetical protein
VGLKTYRGIREPLCHVRVLDAAAAGSPFAPALPPANAHARTAEHELAVPRELVSQALVPFEWGTDGPGTHYLAVALLADLLGAADRAGIKATLPFMRRFLSRLPRDDFEISDTIFRAFLYSVGANTSRALPGPPAGSDGASDGVPEARRDGAGRGDGTDSRR